MRNISMIQKIGDDPVAIRQNIFIPIIFDITPSVVFAEAQTDGVATGHLVEHVEAMLGFIAKYGMIGCLFVELLHHDKLYGTEGGIARVGKMYLYSLEMLTHSHAVEWAVMQGAEYHSRYLACV